MDLINFLSVIYFYLPGAVANMGANVSRFIPFFKKIDKPIDGGRMWKGQRLIGEHKTWGGFLGGVLIGFVFGIFKIFVLDRIWIGSLFLSLNTVQSVFLVFILSFGALTGDVVKSVIKRVLNIPPHSAWIPFDEIDHTTMAMLLVKIFFAIEWRVIYLVIVLYFVLHLISNVIGYKIKIKKVPY